MSAADADTLDDIAASGDYMVCACGYVWTRRDQRGKKNTGHVWRICTFLSQGNRSAARRRLWHKGRRVYAARVVWRLTYGPIPYGMQVDHIEGNVLDERPHMLQLQVCRDNIFNEVRRGRIKWFKPIAKRGSS